MMILDLLRIQFVDAIKEQMRASNDWPQLQLIGHFVVSR